MRNLPRLPLARAVLLAGALGYASGQAVAQESIPGPAAVSRIEALLEDIHAAKQALVARVDYTAATDVLVEEMRNAGASQSAIDKYAKDWAQGYLYLSWSWVQPFYDVHAQALSESLGRARGLEAVPASDVEYLERGMQVWRGAEGEIRLLFEQLIGALVQRGSHLGRSLELSDRKFRESECCGAEWEEFDAQIREQDGQAQGFSVEATYASTFVRDYGSQRYFAAIDPAIEMVSVEEEDMEEECEEDALEADQEEATDLLEEIQMAYDASEAGSHEFLIESEANFNQRKPAFAEQVK